MSDSGVNVSRSGRIRKRSTKLADFQSPDDIDAAKAASASASSPASGRRQRQTSLSVSEEVVIGSDAGHVEGEVIVSDDVDLEEVVDLDIDEQDLAQVPDTDDLDLDDEDDDEEEEGAGGVGGALMIDDTRGRTRKGSGSRKRATQTQQQQQLTTPPRFTPYLLWAKQALPEVKQQNSGLGFGEINRQMSQIWASLAPEHKIVWKQRSRRLAAKMQKEEAAAAAAAAPVTNKAETKRQRKSSSSASKSSGSAAAASTRGTPMSPKPQSRSRGAATGSEGVYKVVGTEPIDAAAHLKLLGESLTVIGERLKEHEGPIAVSGSLSVLLDSLLCAMGPLMCLTQQVPDLDVVPQETLGKILDNVAYIMPGL